MKSQDKKKKKSIVSKVFKYFGIALILLIGVIISIPFLFKDRIKELAIEEANKMLYAEIAVGDFDLTIFSTFPKMKFQFNDVSITGQDEFEGLKLINVKTLEARLDFWSVISMDDITVRSIRLIEPDVNVRILSNGLANYDIVKPSESEEDSESSPFKFSLDFYEIKDGNIIYSDRSSNMHAVLKNVNHQGKGDLTADVINLKTVTALDELSFKMGNVSYLNKVKTDLDADLLIEFKENSLKTTLKNNSLTLNALNLSFDGYYEMHDGYDDIDLKLNTGNIAFKDLLSLIPAVYHTGYESMVAKGDLDLNAFVKGRMDTDHYPAWDVGLKVKNASIAYPDMPENFENVQIVAGSKFEGGSDLDKMTIDIDQLKAEFVGNKIDANFYMKNPMSDPFMKSKINANIDLATINKVYPLEEGSNYNGKLVSDIDFEGRMSAIDNEQYDRVKASGTLKVNDFVYEGEEVPYAVNVSDMLFEFSPQQLKLASLNATMGESDFSMHGDINNYMGYIFKDDDLKGSFAFNSNYINLDQIMPPSTEEAVEEEDVNSDAEPVLVPKRIDFALNTSIYKVKYDGMEINDISGGVRVKDEEVILNNLDLKALGGDVKLSGKYNTQNPEEPMVDFAYNLSKIDIQQLADNFLSIEKLAPVAKYVQGTISSSFSLNSKLTPSLGMVLNSLNGSGDFLTGDIEIAGFKPLEKLGDALQIEKLKKQTLNNIRASFSIEDGKVQVKPFNVKMGGINTSIGGTTSLEQDIDYELKMDIPKNMIPSQVLDIAEKAIAQVKKIPFFEIQMKELPDNIPVTAFITNKLTDPKVSVNLKEKLMELGGDVKDAVKDMIEDKVEEVKDTVKAVIDEKVEEVKEAVDEEVEKQKQKLLSEAQKQADNIVSEAKKLADKTRSEADKNAQKLIDEAGSNPVKKRLAEAAAKKVRDEGEAAAKKIEREAQQRADGVMDKAREKADNLGKK